MHLLQARLRRAALLLFLTGLITLSGCDSLEGLFPTPSPRSFPTLTPGPSLTATITSTPDATQTVTPTLVTPVQAGTALNAPAEDIEPDNASQIDLIAAAGKGIPQQLAVAPEGRFLAVATSNSVTLYDPVSLEERLSISTGQVQQSAAVSVTGWIASGDSAGTISLWNEAGELQQRFTAGSQPVLALAFSPDGARLASSSWDGAIRVWETAEGSVIYEVQARQRPARALTFSPDGSRLYAWALRESVQVWNAENGRSLEEYYIGKDARGYLPSGGAFSPDGALFAANYGSSIRVFFLQKAATLRLISDLPSPAFNVVISPDGRFLGALQEGAANIWNLETGALTARLALDETTSPLLLAFTADSQALVTLGSRLQRWAVLQSPEAEPLLPEAEGVQDFRTSVNAHSRVVEDETLLYVGITGSVEAYDLAEGVLETLLPSLSGEFTSFALSAGGLQALGSSDGVVTLRPLDGGEAVTLQANAGPVRALVFSDDGRLLAGGGDQGDVLVWDVETRAVLHTLRHEDPPQRILFNPDAAELFVLTRSGVNRWVLADEERVQTIPGYAMTLSADGVVLAVHDRSGGIPVVALYRLPSDEPFLSLPLEGAEIALSPDHSLMAMAGQDLTVWSAIDGGLLYRAEDVGVFGALQFSADGRWLVLTAWDGATRVWGVPR